MTDVAMDTERNLLRSVKYVIDVSFNSTDNKYTRTSSNNVFIERNGKREKLEQLFIIMTIRDQWNNKKKRDDCILALLQQDILPL